MFVIFQKFYFQNGYKNEFEEYNEKFAADPEIELPTKSIFQPFGLTSPIRQRGS